MHRTGKDPVTVERMLYCLMRWLAGGIYLDLKLSTGISQAAFYHYNYRCMDAIWDSTELAYKFPETEQELNKSAQGFAALSSHGVCCMFRLLRGIVNHSNSNSESQIESQVESQVDSDWNMRHNRLS